MQHTKFSGKFASPGAKFQYQHKVWGDQATATSTRTAPPRAESQQADRAHAPSHNPADTTAATKPANPNKYTGTACIGVAAMHKSNLVPVFSQQAAVDTATMRRG